MPKCYMCDAESVSVEHAPPKSFFPQGMRNNLITVPSCALHNQDTSPDDEYARNMLTASIDNNQTSIDLFFNKSLGPIKRNAELSRQIRNSLTEVPAYRADAHAFIIDRARIDRILRKVAYALFYKEYGITWERKLAILTNQLKTQEMENDDLGQEFESIHEPFKEILNDPASGIVLKGSNTSVFSYHIFAFGQNQFDKAIFMIFYEGFPVWVIPDKNSSESSFD